MKGVVIGLPVSWWLLALIAAIGVLTPVRAEASVNLPLHHWAYESIERLTAMGIIDKAMVVSKPYSRKEAATYVGRAIERVRSKQIPMDGRETVAEPFLERLMAEFRPELQDLGVLSRPAGQSPGLLRYGARLQTEVDAFSVGSGQTVRFRENRGGEYYTHGEQNQTDVRGWLEVGDWAALMAQPKFISNPQVLGIGATDNSTSVYLREFSLKLTLANIALEVGRGTQWWGPGYHGSLLLTDHAFPLEMIKLGSDQPFRLPWVFSSLGDWKVNTFLAQLERDRDFSRAKVFGLRVSYLPAAWLELGATRLTQFGGRDRDQSFPKAVIDAYASTPNQEGDRDVNEQVMLDFRATIPKVPYLVPFPAGMQLYGELGGEDHWIKRSQVRLTPRGVGYLVGVYIPQLHQGSSMDLRIEYADTRVAADSEIQFSPRVWYSHSVYSSGMRYRGFPLGHHMGTDAKDLFIRTTRYVTDEIQLGANVNLQQRDLLGPSPETKTETAFDLTWWLSSRTQFSVGYTYQRIKNPGQITRIAPFGETFSSGATATNHLLWTSLAVEF